MNIIKFYKGSEIKRVKVCQPSAERMATTYGKKPYALIPLRYPTVAQANRKMLQAGYSRAA